MTRRTPLSAVRGGASVAAALTTLLVPVAAFADNPMQYLVGFGTKNYPVVHLLWALLIISALVVAIVTILLLAGLLRRRATPATNDPRSVPIERSGNGLAWIYIGTVISAVVLVGSAVWTFSTLAAVSMPPHTPELEITIIGHQWWWEVRYESPKDQSRSFTTANEIHIPTGQPVGLTLISNDVNHSFWIPELSGKTDVIPGQQNETWIEADKPGTYRGQCAEYCGLQHAHMAMSVIAETPDRFDAWWAAQLQDPATPQSPTLVTGQQNMVARCGICHTVRGTRAGGRLGPDLSHLMSRRTIAAGTLPNTPGYLSGWIADPQHIKPGNRMPILDLSGPQLASIRAYLETLK